MKFATQYSPNPIKHEKIPTDTIVDAAGYASPKQRIQNLLRAGERLDAWRREMYDLDHDDEDDGYWMDPLRDRSLDYSDYTRLQSESLGRLRAKAKANKASKEAGEEMPQAKQEASKEPAPSEAKETKADG